MSRPVHDVASLGASILMLFVISSVSYYLAAEWRIGSFVISRYALCRGAKRHQISVAIISMVFGVFLRELYISRWNVPGLLYAGTFCVAVGCLCMVRILAPLEWGRCAWVSCLAFTLAMMAVYSIWR